MPAGDRNRSGDRNSDRRSRTRIPADLAGPVEVALAQAVETIPAENAMPGGSRYEPKFDGFRCTAVVRDVGVRLWSRRGTELTAQFSDVARAVSRMLPAGVVVDGELCILREGRLSFEALHKRLVTTSPAKAERIRADLPASFMVFDLLAVGGVDVRPMRWQIRRRRLEGLARAWSPPVQLSPVTSSRAEAQVWFDVLPEQLGIEGLVVKGAATSYLPGARAWRKVKHRATVDVLVGGVLGPIYRPEVVIAGRYRRNKSDGVLDDALGAEVRDEVGNVGDLVMVGRTVPLTARQSADLGAVLRPARTDHPWPDEIGPGHWGRRSGKVALTKVDPVVVAEVTADAAIADGVWRHGLRYLRHRPDLQPGDVETLT